MLVTVIGIGRLIRVRTLDVASLIGLTSSQTRRDPYYMQPSIMLSVLGSLVAAYMTPVVARNYSCVESSQAYA